MGTVISSPVVFHVSRISSVNFTTDRPPSAPYLLFHLFSPRGIFFEVIPGFDRVTVNLFFPSRGAPGPARNLFPARL